MKLHTINLPGYGFIDNDQDMNRTIFSVIPWIPVVNKYRIRVSKFELPPTLIYTGKYNFIIYNKIK